MSGRYDQDVDSEAPNNAHSLALQLVGRNQRVLELGAAGGHVTRALKSRGCEVTAVEIDKSREEELQCVADQTIITDLDVLDLRQRLTGDPEFDVILAGDVLEHCRRPDLVVHQFHSLLKTDGRLVLSIPNVAHGDVRLSLIAGKFEYQRTGLLDASHLRFFTRDTLDKFLNSTGFVITRILTTNCPIGSTEIGVPDAGIPRDAIEYVRNAPNATVYQFVVEARAIKGWVAKTSEVSSAMAEVPSSTREFELEELLSSTREFFRTQMDQLTEEIDSAKHDLAKEVELRVALESRVLEMQQAHGALQQEHQECGRELSTRMQEISQLQSCLADENARSTSLYLEALQRRDAVIGTMSQLGELKFRLEMSSRRITQLESELGTVYRSRTWRIGRLVLFPKRLVALGIRKLRRQR